MYWVENYISGFYITQKSQYYLGSSFPHVINIYQHRALSSFILSVYNFTDFPGKTDTLRV